MTSTDSKRVPELDGLRGIAIGTVLVYHYIALEGITPYLVAHIRGVWRIQPLLNVTQFGWMGVDIFFALSGFLIGGILLDSKGSANFFRVFYARRAFRILPIYTVLCFFAVALWKSGITDGTATHGWLYEEQLPWYAYVTFSQNVWMAMRDAMSSRIIDATWSLAIEEQFYLALPLVLWAVDVSVVPYLLIGGIGSALLFRVLTFEGMNGRAVYLLTYCRMDALLIGVLVAWAWREPRWRARIVRFRRTVMTISGILGVAVFAMAFAGWGFETRLLMTWGLSVIAMWCGSLVVLAISQPGSVICRGLRMPWLGALGGIAYCVYLIHQPTLGLVHLAVRGQLPTLTTVFAFVVTATAFVLVIILGKLSWRWIEGPLIRRGHRFRYAWHNGQLKREFQPLHS